MIPYCLASKNMQRTKKAVVIATNLLSLLFPKSRFVVIGTELSREDHTGISAMAVSNSLLHSPEEESRIMVNCIARASTLLFLHVGSLAIKEIDNAINLGMHLAQEAMTRSLKRK